MKENRSLLNSRGKIGYYMTTTWGYMVLHHSTTARHNTNNRGHTMEVVAKILSQLFMEVWSRAGNQPPPTIPEGKQLKGILSSIDL